MKSTNTTSDNGSSKNNNTKFKKLSSFIYNRHTHDKSMFVEMKQINFMISGNSVFGSNFNFRNMYKLINKVSLNSELKATAQYMYNEYKQEKKK